MIGRIVVEIGAIAGTEVIVVNALRVAKRDRIGRSIKAHRKVVDKVDRVVSSKAIVGIGATGAIDISKDSAPTAGTAG